jgi:hypothetical protein
MFNLERNFHGLPFGVENSYIMCMINTRIGEMGKGSVESFVRSTRPMKVRKILFHLVVLLVTEYQLVLLKLLLDPGKVYQVYKNTNGS